jgi:polyferredoxin
MSMRKVAGVSTVNLVWVLTFIAALIGISIIWAAHVYFAEETLKYEISRDIGIAFLAATIVTLIYEIYSRTRFCNAWIKGTVNQ